LLFEPPFHPGYQVFGIAILGAGRVRGTWLSVRLRHSTMMKAIGKLAGKLSESYSMKIIVSPSSAAVTRTIY
jgi:hypothetical protein